ncbi:Hypothetical predicted protein [Octopus vulgaris]|uniref:Uncharacterized protein n=1 Tax=Octopus vulgaris TaxID=6645 RepID=A0AA36BDE6_OCTVU|nr:Hypothetical predicted protein [Octopus vulgaris]
MEGEYKYVREHIYLLSAIKFQNKISKDLLELDEEWEEDSSDSFYCSEDDGESDWALDSLGSVSSDDDDTQKQISASHLIMNE